MRGDITLQILRAIKEVGGTASDIVGAILSSSHGSSVGRLERAARIAESHRLKAAREAGERARLKQRYYMMISKLGRDGIIEKQSEKNSPSLARDARK